jgi:UDP-N-acetylmuramoyl-tripeptide--D-alanyl-D-alanine ligase
MNTWSLNDILKAVSGTLISQRVTQFKGLGTDTRCDLTGNLFFALRGDQFDAHNFLSKAFTQGAAGVIVDREGALTDDIRARGTVILVSDTLKALQDFAKWHRSQMSVKIVGITGSAGKTSTKEFLATILEKQKRPTYYSKGSFNNHWGVPISLLGIEPSHEIALIEMGMNRAGELTSLVQISDPDIVMCTMVGQAHIEHFSTVERIAQAKEEIYLAAKPSATRIYNLDNPWTLKMYEKAEELWPTSPRVVFSGGGIASSEGAEPNSSEGAKPNSSEGAKRENLGDISLQVESMTLDGLIVYGRIGGVESRVKTKVFGRQNCVNLMAAAAGALACGVPPEKVWEGLSECHTVWGRNQLLQTQEQVSILFDAYNANPESMLALFDNISHLNLPARRIGVLGQMLEMGAASKALHEKLGEQAAQAGFDEVFFLRS